MSSRRTFLIGLAFCGMAAAVLSAYPKTDPVATGPGLVRVDIGGDWQFRQAGREDLAGRLKVRTLRDSY